MHTHSKQRGFTLIELLVVIAIIMILAAILFPVFERAIQNAERANCQSNMKQIALGFKMYLQDNDEKYPAVYRSFGGTIKGVWLNDPLVVEADRGPVIEPYLKSDQILQCPSSENELFSYAMNDDLHLKRESVMNAPTLIVLNWEHRRPTAYSQGCTRYAGAAFGPMQRPGNGCGFPALLGESVRHLDGSNFSFIDGHVKWYKPDALKTVVDGSSPTFKVH